MRRHHELPFGAEPTPEASASACGRRAPTPRRCSWRREPATCPMDEGARRLVFSDHGRCGAGLTATVTLLTASAFPDPASRHQPQSVHGPSEVVDPVAYHWSDFGWLGRPWQEIVFYELHLGTFSGTGDFAGAVQHLDHIVELGATAVELMPIAEFPGRPRLGL